MTVTDAVRERVIERAHHRCEYCQMPSIYIYAPMEIDHIQPLFLDGTDDELYLCLACPRCNGFKGSQIVGKDATGLEIALFNPRLDRWSEHFGWSKDKAEIIALTPCGEATITALRLNIEEAVNFRRTMAAIGAYPPSNIP